MARLSPAVRFGCWQITVIVLTIGQAAAIICSAAGQASRSTILAGAAVFELPIIALLALLLTTPADAIRLSPRRSSTFVIGGTFLLQICVLLATPIRGGPRVMMMSIPIWLVTSAGTFLLQYSRRSPWWIVVIAWNPLLIAAQLLR